MPYLAAARCLRRASRNARLDGRRLSVVATTDVVPVVPGVDGPPVGLSGSALVNFSCVAILRRISVFGLFALVSPRPFLRPRFFAPVHPSQPCREPSVSRSRILKVCRIACTTIGAVDRAAKPRDLSRDLQAARAQEWISDDPAV